MDGKNESKIFKQFIFNEKLSFSQILKKTKIESNLLAYFLKQLIKKELLEKNAEKKYSLTKKGEKLIPYYTDTESLNPLVVILLLIEKNGKILLIKREKRPYAGLYSLPSGRMKIEDTIKIASERISKEKAKIECQMDKICGVVHERMIDTEVRHAFVFFLAKMKVLENSEPKYNAKWFDLKKLPKNKIIASDFWMIKNKLNSSTHVDEETLDKKGKKMKIQK
jgi:ADP-ribose pyrophosphatase YjhB (NUDIX family)/predicted transcriptional regulator